MSRPGIAPGSQDLASCAITARPPQHDTTGPRHRAFDVFQGSCYNRSAPQTHSPHLRASTASMKGWNVVFFLFPVAFILPDRGTFRTDKSVWKERRLARKTQKLVLNPHGSLLCHLGCARKVWSMIKTSLWKTDFLLWSALSQSSLECPCSYIWTIVVALLHNGTQPMIF